MKKIRAIIIAIIVVLVICGCYFLAVNKKNNSTAETGKLTPVQKIITKDLENNYPNTPREVVKLYNRILDSYYDEKYSDDEFEKLCDKALALFDDELRANNPRAAYVESVKADVDDFRSSGKNMTQHDVCGSNDVQYVRDKKNKDELAYVEASYFIKENNSFTKTYQTYVLRKDEQGRWKILAFYMSEKAEEKDD